MKIQQGKYKEEMHVEKWVKCAKAASRYGGLVFLRRMAALARDHHATMDDCLFYRSTIEQQALYAAYQAGTGNYAARPGTSWHEAHCAIDIPSGSNPTWARLAKDWMNTTALSQRIAKEYGVCLPLNEVDAPEGKEEPWHFQPVETLLYPPGGIGKRMTWLDGDDALYLVFPTGIRNAVWASEWMRLTGCKPDRESVRAWQRSVGLKADGIAGPKTWTEAYKRAGIVI